MQTVRHGRRPTSGQDEDVLISQRRRRRAVCGGARADRFIAQNRKKKPSQDVFFKIDSDRKHVPDTRLETGKKLSRYANDSMGLQPFLHDTRFINTTLIVQADIDDRVMEKFKRENELRPSFVPKRNEGVDYEGNGGAVKRNRRFGDVAPIIRVDEQAVFKIRISTTS